MSASPGKGNGQTAESEFAWSTVLPILLLVLGVFFSPLLYDLLQWLQQVGNGA